MENRRQFYRHPLPAWHRVSICAVDGSSSFSGTIVNLSIGGICVKSDHIETTPGTTWIASFALEVNGPPLTMPVERVYARDDQPGYCGFRFLPRASLQDQEQQDRTIWGFLFDEQRRARREARAVRRPTG